MVETFHVGNSPMFWMNEVNIWRLMSIGISITMSQDSLRRHTQTTLTRSYTTHDLTPTTTNCHCTYLTQLIQFSIVIIIIIVDNIWNESVVTWCQTVSDVIHQAERQREREIVRYDVTECVNFVTFLLILCNISFNEWQHNCPREDTAPCLG